MAALSLHCPLCDVNTSSVGNHQAHLDGRMHKRRAKFGRPRDDLYCHVCELRFEYSFQLQDHLHGGPVDGPGSARNLKATPHRYQAAFVLGAVIPFCHLCSKPVVDTFGRQHDEGDDHVSHLASRGPNGSTADGRPWARFTCHHPPPTALQDSQIFPDEMRITFLRIACVQTAHGLDCADDTEMVVAHAGSEEFWMFNRT